MYIPEDKIEEIKNVADIVDIVSETVLLKRTGKNYVGLCPFHSEKTPSFIVSPDKQIFHCYGCQTGGNVFTFLMKIEGLAFPDAAKALAERYGVDIPVRSLTPEQKKRIGEKERLLEINKEAMGFFRGLLTRTDWGKTALAYLERRGITPETIDHFQLGYAPEGWDRLLTYFSKKNTPLPLLEKSGLIIERNAKNGYYDRFRNRIIFPIIDERRRVVGFGGRVLNDDLPKYLNSPETPVYNKRKTLYGLDRAKRKARETGVVYIVEGYFDAIALHQFGIENAVATLGTALTSDHAQLIKRGYAENIILVYDSDEAGIKAALRSVDIFRAERLNARILVLPKGYDPDTFLFEFGTETFLNAAEKAQTMMGFMLDSAIAEHGLSPEGKINIIGDLTAFISAVQDRMEKAVYIRELAEKINIDETIVFEKVQSRANNRNVPAEYTGSPAYGAENPPAADTSSEHPHHDAIYRLEKQILKMMVQFHDALPEIEHRKTVERFQCRPYREIGKWILTHASSGKTIADGLEGIEDNQQQHIVTALAIEEEEWSLKGCIKLLEQYDYIRRRCDDQMNNEIKAAAAGKDPGLLDELLKKKLMQARKRLNNLQVFKEAN